MKRHVLVNVSPRDICALSGTVTSSIMTALSVHVPAEEAASVPPGVPGVVVVDTSGVKVSDMSVGKDKLCFVGGSVEVTNSAAVGAGVSSESVIQELRPR